jgi:hypothetical protein
MRLLFTRSVRDKRAAPEQLDLIRQDCLDIESWLRTKAAEWETKDRRVSTRLERGADEMEKAAGRLTERIEDNTGDPSNDG